ncbi:hypothetical protein OHA40_07980 [Nocardia sp. NBC_00508]|uniref:hypothetical protein n=1 Tax=Nocardia sp. NBC_00508 TaxID=2975992 RepID=UPI002E806587|nr:hypothetical protein [Nocardia sp. NBC_00508]WUD68046.1 hypothetical protein OHA40_07980 [Nocardia sp. NBC_00508]
MSSHYQPTAGWSPPGAQFRTSNNIARTLVGTVVCLVVTPIGIGLAASGSLDTRQWVILGSAGDRWGSNAQIIGGALLLFLVAVLAAYSPAGTVIAGLVWGLLPGAMQIFSPDDTWRLIEQSPALSPELRLAVHNWVLNGLALMLGLILIGAGLAATLRRR